MNGLAGIYGEISEGAYKIQQYKYKIKFVERAVVDKVESEALGGQRWLNVAGTGG